MGWGDRVPERAEGGQWDQRQRWALTPTSCCLGCQVGALGLFEPWSPLFPASEMSVMETCLSRKRKQLADSRNHPSGLPGSTATRVYPCHCRPALSRGQSMASGPSRGMAIATGCGAGLGCRAFPVSFPICMGLAMTKDILRRSCLGGKVMLSSVGERPLLAILPWLNSHIPECVWCVAATAVGRVRWSAAAVRGQGRGSEVWRERASCGLLTLCLCFVLAV